ncbi:MAG: tetratricopeptide repeat protein [Bacteroidetes bacterium]|nr:tetratricopeptide repeat protein [Bacteroidota bacterium]
MLSAVKIWIWLGVGLVLSSCSTRKIAKTPQEQTQKIPQYAIDRQFTTALLMGQTALLRNDFQTAQKNFQSCLSLQPQNPEALFRLAQTEYKLGNIEKSLDLAEKAIKFDKENILWYRFFYAEVLQNKGELAKYAEQMQTIIEKHPEEKFLYTKTDSAWRSINNLNKSEMLWSKYKTIFSDDILFAEQHLLDIYLLQNKKNDAFKSASYIYESAPNDGYYILKYAKALATLGKNEDLRILLNLYQNPARLNVNQQEFYQGAYYLSFNENMPQLAVNYAAKAIEYNDDKKLIEHFANAIQKNFFDGISLSETLKIAANNLPYNSDIQFLAGVQLFKENKFEDAISFFKTSKDLGNTSFNLYNSYCQALFKSGHLQELKKISSEALELYPFSEELKKYSEIDPKN